MRFLFLVALCTQTCTAANLRFIDGRDLPLEGKAFANTPTYYERLPVTVTTNVNATARKVAHDAAGLQFRFRTDSDVLDFRWMMRPTDKLSDVRIGSNMTGILAKGIDIYRQKPDGTWAYVATGCPKAGLEQSFRMDWTPGDACLVYLPCYGAVTDFRLGVKDGATVSPVPHASEAKPVVFYGTSITQGGSASRPGLAWVSQLGRTLDVPVVNLGFSGSAQMEIEMADHLAAIDASCYVLDCIANMYTEWVEARVEPFVRKLRAARPDVPIVLAERTVIDAEAVERNAALKAAYDRLVADGFRNLYYVPAKRLRTGDGEDTVEGGHPNDVGMATIAAAFTRAVRTALSLPVDRLERVDPPACELPEGMEYPDVLVSLDEPFDLPELLKTADGRAVTTKEEWERVRRPEILRFFTEEIFGVRPVERPADLTFERLSPDKVMLGGKAIRKRIVAKFSGPRRAYRFTFTAFIPTAVKKPAVFINMAPQGRDEAMDANLTLPNGYWPVREIIDRGYATIGYLPGEVAWDEYHPHFVDGAFVSNDPELTNDVFSCFAERRTETSWGAISAWAWGASRIADWVETEPLLDAKRIVIVGHSRCGKTALWCGATDPRFAMVCANDSGAFGAKLNHVKVPYGGSMSLGNVSNPHWFCRACRKYNGREAKLPYDQHWLLALTAPRLLCIGSASKDTGAGPWAECLSARYASPVWELYGLKGLVEDGPYGIERPYQEGLVGYHLRRGGHTLAPYDWNRYMDFADKHLMLKGDTKTN